MKLDFRTYSYSSKKSTNLILIFAGLALLSIAWFVGLKSKEFYFSYLTSYFFWLSIILGGMFFTFVHHAFSATWSVAIRRIMENTIMLIPVFTILFLPIITGMEILFKWLPNHSYWLDTTNATYQAIYDYYVSLDNDAETAAKAASTAAFEADHLIQHKLPFLNKEFFLQRASGYFILWNIIAFYIYFTSTKHDITAEHDALKRLKNFTMSPMGVLLFTSISFAGLDWLMSLDPHWYSTMYGVYTFAGSFLAFLGFLTFTLIRLQDQGYLKGIVSEEHYHDLGKYLFAFSVFYCYIAGAQFYFIWYSNIPEETIWYLHRWVGSWKTISVLLIVGKFFIPFFILVFRASKRNIRLLQVMSIWIIFMHYIDINFIVMPTLHHHDFHIGIYDISSMLGFAAIFIGSFRYIMSRTPLVPISDPELIHSINHRNH